MENNKTVVKRLTQKETALIEAFRETFKVEGSAKVIKDNIVQQEGGLWLILSDIHVPAHNEKLISNILDIISSYSLEGIVFAGDFLDMYSIASFNKGSLKKLGGWSLSDEYNKGCELLDRFDKVINKNTQVVFLFGNHEERFEREISTLDNTKYGEALIDVRKGLKLDSRGYTVIEDYPDGVFRIGNKTNGVDIIHGQRINKYPSAATLNDNGGNVIFCHTHRFSSFSDNLGTGYNIGCLIDIDNPLFGYMSRMQRKRWTNGFAFVNKDLEGNSFVEPIKVDNNQFYFRGKKY